MHAHFDDRYLYLGPVKASLSRHVVLAWLCQCIGAAERLCATVMKLWSRP